jgi:hypothetical protein
VILLRLFFPCPSDDRTHLLGKTATTSFGEKGRSSSALAPSSRSSPDLPFLHSSPDISKPVLICGGTQSPSPMNMKAPRIKDEPAANEVRST